MKLDKIYNKVVEKVTSNVKEGSLIDYIKNIEATGRYNNLTVRVVNDIKSILFSPQEICSWYDEYHCNDNHVTTLFKKVIRENYPTAWKVTQEA